jgi:hypothetical protein
LIVFFILSPVSNVYSQDDDYFDNIELTQEQWEAVRDTFAYYAIMHLVRLDTLNMEIDSLKKVNEMIENYDCDKELYALVGATKEDVADFRRKFDETEKKINGKIGSPDDARKMYFDEIQNSKIRCLPEFAERYDNMYSNFTSFFITEKTIIEGTYEVVKGDCLWWISRLKYNTPYLWPAIWDANKTSIVNPENFYFTNYHKISNPDFIYPGQVLKIPKISDAQRKEAEEKSKQFRRVRKTKEN